MNNAPVSPTPAFPLEIQQQKRLGRCRSADAEATTLVLRPTWAVLVLAWCCVLAAAAAAATEAEDSSSSSTEATTAAISSLAYDSVTVQDTRPAAGADRGDSEDDDKTPGVKGEDAPVMAAKSPSEKVVTGDLPGPTGPSNATAEEHGEGDAEEDDDDDDEDDDDDDDDDDAEKEMDKRVEASTSKSVKITVSKVTGSGEGEKRSLEAEVVIPGPDKGPERDETAITEKTKLAEDTLHAPAVELMQGPRVRRRPSSTAALRKDDRRVVRQGDGSFRSREAMAAARNARSRKAASQPPREDPASAPGNELPAEPKPKKRKSSQRRRKSRKGVRKTKPSSTPTPSTDNFAQQQQPLFPEVPAEVWSQGADGPASAPLEAPAFPKVLLPSPPALVTEPPPLPSTEAAAAANKYPDFPVTTGNPKRDDVNKAASLRPEVRVTRQEDEAEASMEALQTATDEVRIARQGGRRLNVDVQRPAVDFQQVDVNPDGSYRFAYNTNDEGQHFRIEQANSDNLVAGRYGYRDAEGRPVQTVYTAGPRGFRARGTDIARKMDLSQGGGRAPRPPPDGRYSPEYDNYFDPLEDPSYSFAFRTPTYARKEDADGRGDVTGVYSYIDDVGERHVVQYEAGAEKGFNVINSFPDNVPAPGYHLGPGNPPRGRTTIVQNRDGSYRFVAAGPDSRREEVSDQVNNRRGSYSYIDDKGVQQTVEYIAGPGIGYRIINKHKGVVIPPTYATSFPPFSSSPFPVSPTLPTFTPTPAFPSSSFSPFPSPFPTAFPSPFPETIPPSAFPPPFSSIAPPVFPSSTVRPGGSSGRPGSGRPGYGKPSVSEYGGKPGGAGYPGSGSSTTGRPSGRPNNQYIPPRPPPTSAPSIPPPFGDLDDPFSELFPGETGTPLRPGSGAVTSYGGSSSGGSPSSSSGGGSRPGVVRPVKKPKPSVSIDTDDDDDDFFPTFPQQTGGSGSGSPRPSVTTSGYPTTTTGTSTTTASGGGDDDDNTIDGLFGDGGDVSSTPRPTQRPRPSTGTLRPPASSTSSGGDDFLDLFPTAGPSSTPGSPSSSPRPAKRPRPRPRPRPTTSRPTPSVADDFDSLFNPTPVYTDPADIPTGYDYTRPKKPLKGSGGGAGGAGGGVIYPTTIRPGRLPTRPSVGGGDDFLSELEGGGGSGGGGGGGQWSGGGGGRPAGFWPAIPYGNCCPGPLRPHPHRFRDERDDGGVYPGRPFPPGAVVRAHVQSVDLMPFEPEHRAMDPGEALERYIRQEQSLHAHRQRSVDPADGPGPSPGQGHAHAHRQRSVEAADAPAPTPAAAEQANSTTTSAAPSTTPDPTTTVTS
ncbi:Adult-specific rigid cuticular protein 12.6 [Frankliniella fusca]|uniref:Adult-specific rigid cuticular protein 12.6 n=1 Tax=Frankliniella fusca TaxID=407009 RepID=A0AAE1H766_9NEOP|nr:Adult-specific rigid cuticular protein 12.6 [Frankliniella fusca]